MTASSAYRAAATQARFSDHYVVVLALLLGGYAVFGKSFAYLGVPPLYVGELVFALGAIAFLSSRCAVASFATLPNLLLTVLIFWAIVRTLPFVGEFGVDALRDSVIVLYGGFAFIITALLLEKPERLQLAIKFLRIIALVLIPLAPILVLMTNVAAHSDTGPVWQIAQVKTGTLGVHLAAAALLAFLGFRSSRLLWVVLLLIGMAAVATQNRGGMLAIMFMLSFAAIATGKLREFGAVLLIGISLLGLAYALDLSVPTARYDRDISAEQLIDNLQSVIGGGQAELSGTSAWRLRWWNTIIDYTLNGPYFWSGKGFGVNLAIADGVTTGQEIQMTPPTRSPHNGHFTILARTGVIGLGLWLLTLGSWSAVVLRSMISARRRGERAWADFFVLIFCYAIGLLIDAAFDVALEGPMAGIWFWCLFGGGVGASMIYRAECAGIGPSRRRLGAAPATASAS